MPILLSVAAVAILAFTLWDVFITVFSTVGAGPLTQLWTRPLWKGLLHIHHRRPIHHVLTLTGPFTLIAGIILWYLLLGLAIFLLVLAAPSSVVDGNTKEPADAASKLYFTNTTLSSLGYGDYVPAGLPWTLISTFATLAGTIVVTVSLSYVLSVISAAIGRRTLARSIYAMGNTPGAVVEAARLGDPGQTLKPHVLNLANQIDHLSVGHLAYPILKYFHSSRHEMSPTTGLLLLADAFFVMQMVPDHLTPPPGVRRVVESSLRGFLDLTRSMNLPAPLNDPRPHHLLETIRSLGGSPTQAQFNQALTDYLPLRHQLLALCHEDGWSDQVIR